MTRRPRRNHSSAFKVKVALAALKADAERICRELQRTAQRRMPQWCEPSALPLSWGALALI